MNVLFLERVVGTCARLSGIVVLAVLAAGAAGGYYSANHFKMNTDTASLISSNAEWRKRQIAFDADFPQQKNLIVAVIDGATPERAEEGASALADALSKNKRLFPLVRRPDAGAYFEHNALLFLPEKDVHATTQQMIGAQPFLGALASDPSLRGVMDSLSTALLGVQHGQTTLTNLDGPIRGFAGSLEKVASGQTAFMSWQQLVTGGQPNLQ